MSGQALEEICASYWYPLYSWLRRRGESNENAEDLVQGLFRYLLRRGDLKKMDPDNGKLRTFLLKALKNFSIKEHEKANALKRGGGQRHVPLDAEHAEARYHQEPASDPKLSPDAHFDRVWATLLLDQVFAELRQEYAKRDAEKLFDLLKAHIAWNAADRPLQEVSNQLGMREGAVRVAVVRLRKRFRRLLQKKVALTVGSEEELADEIAYLRRVF